MPSIPIIMPQLGESIAEATIVNLLVPVGDQVQTDQDIIEVETSKATMNVASPCPGRVERFLVKLGESYPVGAVLGYLEASPADAARLGLDVVPARNGEESEAGLDPSRRTQTESTHKSVQPTVRGLPVPANAAGASYMSPRMKARMVELGLHAADLAGLPGSGTAGRVTIQDFEKFIANLEQHKLSQASTMRVAVADAMRRSWTRPLATVALPVCFDALLNHRRTCNPKPGPALYALRALALALSENSAPAGRLIAHLTAESHAAGTLRLFADPPDPSIGEAPPLHDRRGLRRRSRRGRAGARDSQRREASAQRHGQALRRIG